VNAQLKFIACINAIKKINCLTALVSVYSVHYCVVMLKVEITSDAVCGSDIKTDAAAEKIPPEV